MEFTNEQEKMLRKALPNFEELKIKGNKRALLIALYDYLLDTFDDNQNPTAETVRYQRLYDQIYYEM